MNKVVSSDIELPDEVCYSPEVMLQI